MYFATAKEMKKLDDLAVKSNLKIIQMMELAGWHMVSLFKLLRIKRQKKVLIVCGKGNNGGDGLAASRMLINAGFQVKVILLSRKLRAEGLNQLSLLRKMKTKLQEFSANKKLCGRWLLEADVIIDSLIGYNLKGAPKGDYALVINLINRSRAKVISYDLPSGFEANSGECLNPCVVADATLALALPKKGFLKGGNSTAGRVFVADLGIPKIIYDQVAKNSRANFENHPYFLATLHS